MKTPRVSLLAMTLLITAAVRTHADTSARVGFGIDSSYFQTTIHQPWKHHEDRPYRHVERVPITAAPVAYYPVYIPVAPPQPVVTGLTGDYGTDLANLDGRISRLRRIVENQHQNNTVSQEEYEHFMNALDGIEQDERARAFDRSGNLTDQDFAEFYSRLDQASDEIEIALAD